MIIVTTVLYSVLFFLPEMEVGRPDVQPDLGSSSSHCSECGSLMSVDLV
jgi:hypothetical protein